MRKFLSAGLLLILSCNGSNSETETQVYNYTYLDPTLNRTINCVQVNSNLIDERNTISMEAIRHELVDSTKALVKVFGQITSTNNERFQIITPQLDTLTCLPTFNYNFPDNFINRKVIAQGEIKVHPSIRFQVNALLVLGLSIQE